MRTTLDIEDDVLQAARELAQSEGGSIGQSLSKLARRGLKSDSARPGKAVVMRGGVPVLPSRGEVVTGEHIRQLMDKEGI